MARALEDGDGFWEDDRWLPFGLSATSGSEFDGRIIPIAWEIEFNPWDEEFEAANIKLAERGIEPDGYGWGEYIRDTIQKADPALGERLHIEDCETSTCAIWVESEDDCRKLLEMTWKLVFPG